MALEACFTPDSQFVMIGKLLPQFHFWRQRLWVHKYRWFVSDAGSEDGRVHVWSTESGMKVAVLDGKHPGPINTLQFNPRFMTFASACTNMVSDSQGFDISLNSLTILCSALCRHFGSRVMKTCKEPQHPPPLLWGGTCLWSRLLPSPPEQLYWKKPPLNVTFYLKGLVKFDFYGLFLKNFSWHLSDFFLLPTMWLIVDKF